MNNHKSTARIAKCPTCKGSLIEGKRCLKCNKCDREYYLKNGIPVLIDLMNVSDHLAQQIEYFEREKVSIASKYSISPWQKNYLKRFLDNYPDIEEKCILDCGTGSGYMAVELAKLGAKVVACDLTLNSLTRLKVVTKGIKSKHKIEFVCCSADELPFSNKQFDYFISNAVLEHLPQEEKAIVEIDRVTKSGGGLMLTVPIQFKYLFPLLIPINWIHDMRIGHLRRYDLKAITKKFKGWKVIKTYYTGHIEKVIKTLVNIIVKIFDEEDIERQDSENTKTPVNSSNVICFLRK